MLKGVCSIMIVSDRFIWCVEHYASVGHDDDDDDGVEFYASVGHDDDDDDDDLK